jgi:hypothetical protein
MNSKSNLIYALAAVTSLALGLGVSFWRAATEANELRRGNHAAEMALGAAQDEMKVLRERLTRETKTREYAEAAQTVAEHTERAVREKLAHETKAHQATEAARAQASAEQQAASIKLASTGDALRGAEEAKVKAESALLAANAQLAQTEEARQSIEIAWQRAVYNVIIASAQLNDEASARKAAEGALASAEDQVRVLNAKLAPAEPGKEGTNAAGGIGAAEAPAVGAARKNKESADGTGHQLRPAHKSRTPEHKVAVRHSEPSRTGIAWLIGR